jgi:hypothetical protein
MKISFLKREGGILVRYLVKKIHNIENNKIIKYLSDIYLNIKAWYSNKNGLIELFILVITSTAMYIKNIITANLINFASNGYMNS